MSRLRPLPSEFRKRFIAGEQVVGTFIKTRHGVMVGGAAEAKSFKGLGASAFIVSTDQGFLRRAAGQALTELNALGVMRIEATRSRD